MPDDHGHRAALEQDPREDVQEHRHEDAGDDARAARHAKACLPTSTSATSPPRSNARSCWRSVAGYSLVVVHDDRGRGPGQRRVRVDRVRRAAR